MKARARGEAGARSGEATRHRHASDEETVDGAVYKNSDSTINCGRGPAMERRIFGVFTSRRSLRQIFSANRIASAVSAVGKPGSLVSPPTCRRAMCARETNHQCYRG